MEVPYSQSCYLCYLLITRGPRGLECSTEDRETEILVLSLVMSMVLHFSLVISIWFISPIPMSVPTLFPYNF